MSRRSSFIFYALLGLSCWVSLGGSVQAQPPKEFVNQYGMKFVLISKGKFLMGAPDGEPGRLDRELQHEVTISKDFYLGVTEVTQEQMKLVKGMKYENYPFFHRENREGDNKPLPAEQIDWRTAEEFCWKLSRATAEREANRFYRLPTEAEWEYACRAGSRTAYYFGDSEASLTEHGWYSENSERNTHPVGQGKPNAWGLYDMHGNVSEWCSDWYGPYPKGPVTNPRGPELGTYRVLRGGSWLDRASRCRSASRNAGAPETANDVRGFRVAFDVPN